MIFLPFLIIYLFGGDTCLVKYQSRGPHTCHRTALCSGSWGRRAASWGQHPVSTAGLDSEAVFFFYLKVRSWTTVMVNVPDRLFHIIFHFQSPFSQATHLCAELHCAEALCPGACCGAGIHSKHRRYSKPSMFQETIQTFDVGISIVWQGSKKDHHFKYKCAKSYLQN